MFTPPVDPTRTRTVTVLSSMAMKHLLADAAAAWRESAGGNVSVESIGGVDAARRVIEGEMVDLVILASDAIDGLLAAGRLQAGSRVDIAVAQLAAAVRAGAPCPAMQDDDALRSAVRSAGTVGLSTGPSGSTVRALFARWGLIESLGDRLVQATPGVSVGTLVARGEVELGFQQLSELIHIDGIHIVSELAPSLDTTTTFSGALGTDATNPEQAQAFLAHLRSTVCDRLRQRHGLNAAR